MLMVATVTGTRLLTTCITLLGIFTAMMVNNHRISHLDRRIDDMRDVLRGQLRAERAETNTRFSQVDARLDKLDSKMDSHHETVLRLLADMENRIR
jgi:hypothetical protein